MFVVLSMGCIMLLDYIGMDLESYRSSLSNTLKLVFVEKAENDSFSSRAII